MKLKVGIIIVIFIKVIIENSFVMAQDFTYNNQYSQSLHLNPAFAGNNHGDIQMGYKEIWPAVPDNFSMYSVSYQHYIPAISGGLALMLQQENQINKTLKNTKISAVYSYHMKINKKVSVNTGFQYNYNQHKLDFEKLIFTDQFDGTTWTYNTTEKAPASTNMAGHDGTIGTIVYLPNVYAGISASHFIKYNSAFYGENRAELSYTAIAGTQWIRQSRSDKENSPKSFYTTASYFKQGKSYLIDIGNNYEFSEFSIQMHYKKVRKASSLCLGAGFIKSFLRFGYAYEFSIAGQPKFNGGVHEINISLNFINKMKNFEKNIINIPKF